ncbi:MAG: hypothetical protein ACFFB0_15260 [Promethearchaeota archaeon]
MTSDEKVVIIKPNAYYKMLLHVLRFGNKVIDRSQYREVMGVCIGRLEGDPDKKGIRNVVVEDAVPISHGGSIEVDFAPEDYVTFSMVDNEYADKGLFSCGWFHSHPGLDIFFSNTDVKNQLGWQTEFNPSGFGIVFDHTYLERSGDLGFRTFRLNNPSKPSDGYYEIKTIVEPPDNKDYYLKLMDLIGSIHTKEPPLLEINELPDLFGDIAFPSEEQLKAKIPEFNVEEIISAIHNGLSKFIEISINPLISFLNSWSQDVIKNIVENNFHMRMDLLSIKDNINQGISNLQKELKFSFKDKLNDLDIYIDDTFEEFGENQEKLKDQFNQFILDLKDQLNSLFETKLKDSLGEMVSSFEQTIDQFTKIETNTSLLSEKLKSQFTSLNKNSEKIRTIENETFEKINSLQEELLAKIIKSTNKIVGNFINLNKETKSFLSDLKAAIIVLESSKTSIKNKIDILENENKSLQKDIKDLKTENENLLKKLKKLEGGQ